MGTSFNTPWTSSSVRPGTRHGRVARTAATVPVLTARSMSTSVGLLIWRTSSISGVKPKVSKPAFDRPREMKSRSSSSITTFGARRFAEPWKSAKRCDSSKVAYGSQCSSQMTMSRSSSRDGIPSIRTRPSSKCGARNAVLADTSPDCERIGSMSIRNGRSSGSHGSQSACDTFP
ncbi:hypothetical protein RRF57_011767 [Xylaria bambusicola]|uniref:Uncharacterized protein n=1 Tax=Xylaria bambusicola TaxID=326684 RepID=A0AAN7UNE1_9PEZI